MAQAGDDYAEADVQDVGEHYGEAGQIGHGPYYDMPNVDPSLLGINISPSQAYAADMSSENLTPSKSKRKPAARTKNGKRKRVAEVEEPEPQESSEEDNEAEKDEDAEPESEEEEEEEYEPEPVVSKRTRASLKRKVATPETPKSASKSSTKTRSSTRKSKSASKKDDVLPFHRSRRPPSNITDARPIARSFEECDEADKKLIVMRDQGKKTWAEIRGVWEAITKQKTGKSTLPNRYERLKDNFSVIKEEDRPRLLVAKEEVERDMNEQKWQLIADKVQADGGGEYSADHLQRQYKKLMVREGLRPPPGIVDRDFDIAISADEYGSD